LAYATPPVAARRSLGWLRFTAGGCLVLAPLVYSNDWSMRLSPADVAGNTVNLVFDAGVIAALFLLGLRLRRRDRAPLGERHWAITCASGIAAIVLPIVTLFGINSLGHPSERLLVVTFVLQFAALAIISPWWVFRKLPTSDWRDGHDSN
jgi:hypothetical protein